MDCTLHATTKEHAEGLAAALEADGYSVELLLDPTASSSSPPIAGPADESTVGALPHRRPLIVFVDAALGLERIRSICGLLCPAGNDDQIPLIAIFGPAMDCAATDDFIRAGVSIYLGDYDDTSACRLRFLRNIVQRGTDSFTRHRESEERYRTVFEALDEGLLVQSRDGTVLETNAATARILGMNEAEVRTRTWRTSTWRTLRPDGSVYPLDELPPLRVLATNRAIRGEVVGVEQPDGRVVWISVNCYPLPGPADDEAGAVVTTITEVTERRRAQADFLRFLEHAPDAVLIHRNTTTLWCNHKWATLCGFADPRSLVGRSVLEFSPARNRAIVAARVKQREAGQELPTIADKLLRADGSEVDVEVTGMPTFFEGLPALMVVARDTTERRRMEAQLMATDRLAALGRLAASVGHEINNPLVYIMANLRRAAEKLRHVSYGGSDTVGMLEEAIEGTERIAQIVSDLKVFAPRRNEQIADVDVHRVLESCIRIAEGNIRVRARLVRDFGDVPLVRANDARLAQVFLNLLTNAAQAIPEGMPRDAHAVTISTRLANNRVVVRVEDTGEGIPPEHLPRLFEAFFTTKSERGGTGLGLSICRTLLAAQGGEIGLESEVGRGTVVTVSLAAKSSEAEGAPLSTRPPPDATVARKKVLVVDDEPFVARSIRDSLSQYDVDLAESGREALARLDGGRYDAIVCDVMMPTMSGIELYEELTRRKRGEEQRVVFMTGGAYTGRAARFLSECRSPCIEKPFRMSVLVNAIEKISRQG